MPRTCAACGAAGDGAFCAACGVRLDSSCPACGHEPPPQAKFCNACGASLSAPAPAGTAKPSDSVIRGAAPWLVAGAAVAALAVFLLLPGGRDDVPGPLQTGASAVQPSAAQLGPSGVDISSMTPRERADRLFNRVMQSVSEGDSTQAQAFVPMAIAAYEQVPELDLDGRYHAAVLHLVGNDPRSARAEAQRILDADPNHLFGLFTAAQSEAALGNASGARDLYGRFLESYEAEVARELPEYQDHARVLPINREEAQRAIGGG